MVLISKIIYKATNVKMSQMTPRPLHNTIHAIFSNLSEQKLLHVLSNVNCKYLF